MTPAFAAGAALFFAAEIEVYQPNPGLLALTYGHGTRAHGTLSLRPLALEAPGTIRASDTGYRTRADDPGGLRVYPPVLDTAFAIDRRVGLAPGDASTRTYGSIRLSNLGERFDAYTLSRNSDNRPARILIGAKAWDSARGYQVHPSYTDLLPLFGGVALPWLVEEEAVTIPLADPAAWLDRPVQDATYVGTGGLEGGADLAGKPKPMTRGGTLAAPVCDVPLVLVDAAALIYQWTDGPGAVQTLYEGGQGGFTYDGDVADLYAAGSPAPGHYRTNRARGLLRLGSKPVYTLSADVTGAFPSAAATLPGSVALALLTEDMSLSPAVLDLPSFGAADVLRPYVVGYYVGTEPVQGAELLGNILVSINARLISTRSGLLSLFLLAPLPVGIRPEVALNPSNAVSVKPQALPAALDPPPYRVQVSYATIWQTQSSGLNGAVSAARRQELATADRYATAFSPLVRAQYRRPNDLAPTRTVLLQRTAAQAMASLVLELFASRPGYYLVEVPIDAAARIDIGTVVHVTWPLADLAVGRIGQVVGEQIRSDQASVTFLVLMSSQGGDAPISATAPLGIFTLGIHELA